MLRSLGAEDAGGDTGKPTRRGNPTRSDVEWELRMGLSADNSFSVHDEEGDHDHEDGHDGDEVIGERRVQLLEDLGYEMEDAQSL